MHEERHPHTVPIGVTPRAWRMRNRTERRVASESGAERRDLARQNDVATPISDIEAAASSNMLEEKDDGSGKVSLNTPHGSSNSDQQYLLINQIGPCNYPNLLKDLLIRCHGRRSGRSNMADDRASLIR